MREGLGSTVQLEAEDVETRGQGERGVAVGRGGEATPGLQVSHQLYGGPLPSPANEKLCVEAVDVILVALERSWQGGFGQDILATPQSASRQLCRAVLIQLFQGEFICGLWNKGFRSFLAEF